MMYVEVTRATDRGVEYAGTIATDGRQVYLDPPDSPVLQMIASQPAEAAGEYYHPQTDPYNWLLALTYEYANSSRIAVSAAVESPSGAPSAVASNG